MNDGERKEWREGRDRGEFHPSRKGVKKNMLLKSGKHDAIGGERQITIAVMIRRDTLRRKRYYCTCTYIYTYIYTAYAFLLFSFYRFITLVAWAYYRPVNNILT